VIILPSVASSQAQPLNFDGIDRLQKTKGYDIDLRLGRRAI